MLISDFLSHIKEVIIPVNAPEYVVQAAELLASGANYPEILRMDQLEVGEHQLLLAGIEDRIFKGALPFASIEKPERYIWMKLNGDGSGMIITSHSYYLFSFIKNLTDNWLERKVSEFQNGGFIPPSFTSHRTAYDYFLNQEGRICRGFERESYIRELACNGFTHLEVNGLAYPMGIEKGVKGEAYPMFYTYCPALDQFVYSDLNKGLYPYYYLEANLNLLKDNARIAKKYGLVPGLLCFEPRSVPEEFFEKYPMLRGARVDHPFRSFKPRYNMTITHPKVREHYAEMMGKLMKEIPELGFINIWTNDSGAGFEHTKSLYVGRNGGAYLIREWKDDDEIARLAGENALRFMNTLRDAGREFNPEFRVITRMESFYGEHEIVARGLHDGLEIETSSLVQRGWDMPYHHPEYEDQNDINAGSVYQRDFYEDEIRHINTLRNQGSETSIYFGYGPQVMFAPLLGIPYPWLTFERLKQLSEQGVRYLSHMGGSVPAELAPYNINHQLISAFQYNQEIDPGIFIKNYARKKAGDEGADKLITAWKLTEKAILSYPNVSSLYSTIGFTWYRLWVRPLVPDIEAVPQQDRDYYENFMCTTPHNPNNVDFSRDVLFRLINPEKSRIMVKRIDENVWENIDKAIMILANGGEGIVYDQLIRLKALRCWFMTQRNIASWVDQVYRYLNRGDEIEGEGIRSDLKETIKGEMANTEELITLMDTGVEFMALTDKGETPLVYGRNIKDHLIRKMALMAKHIDDKPRIDHNYMERKAGEPI